ncbi:major facilitator superfamily domain-containing protein [Immersiella caudata]|uniref:Major facilitator superfamily domain-containing protein n=1 Tax=Immersiella caudata TaxID=314043 RepID=A0AA39WX61_9PEZI|nr:major facilitator superfamily domain-containing protein [Immersiella caudata]
MLKDSTEISAREAPKPSNPPSASDTESFSLVCPSTTTPRRLLLRTDFRILPLVCALYLVAFLDRVNIANARAFGLEADLGLTGVQFNTALTIFFIPYVLFEIPSNILLKRLSPRLYLSGCCFGFGLVTTLQGFCTSYGGLLAARFFLGLFECGMVPGCFYLIGMWYRRSEAQTRFSLFFASTALAGAFGGLLASAIGKMDGMRGYLGWRWIFILEGLLTCVVALGFLAVFPDFVEGAKWLTQEERAYIQARLAADQGPSAAERKVTFADVKKVMSDFKVWFGGLIYFALVVPAYGYAFFSPTILLTYRYTPIETQLRSVPPYAAAFGFSMLVAVVSDRIRHRVTFVVVGMFISIAGLAMLFNIHNKIDTQYGALFLVAGGLYAAMPVAVCWFNMNLLGHHRRSIGVAWQIGFGNIGAIISTYSFLREDAPLFKKGYIICFSFLCLGLVSTGAYATALWWENRKRDKMERVEVTEEERKELGDLNPEFRYMY